MQRHRSVQRVLGTALALLITTAGTAQAQGRPAASSTKDRDISYVFEDDPLQAGATNPNDVRIMVFAYGMRQQLIRPRTAFVPELLKTVENL